MGGNRPLEQRLEVLANILRDAYLKERNGRFGKVQAETLIQKTIMWTRTLRAGDASRVPKQTGL